MKNNLFVFCFIILFTLLLVCNNLPCANAQEYHWEIVFPTDLFSEEAYLVIGQTKLWYVNQAYSSVLCVEGKSNFATSQKQEIENDTIVFGVASEENNVYIALSSDAKTVIKKDLSTHQTLAAMDVPTGATVQNMCLVDNTALLVSEGKLWTIDLLLFDKVCVFGCDGLHTGNILAISSYDSYLAIMFADGTLSVLQYTAPNFQVLDEKKFEIPLSAICLNRDYTRYGLVYGAQTDNNTVWNDDMHSGKAMKSDSICWPAATAQLWSIDGGLYIRDTEGAVWRYMLDDIYLLRSSDVYEHTLSILNDNFSGLSVAAINLFHDKFPRVALQFTQTDHALGSATLIQAEKYDILCVKSGEYLLSDLVRSGAIQPLHRYPEILRAKNELIDLLDACTVNGDLYMIPTKVNLYVWQVNLELFEKIGLSQPCDGWTIHDFFALGEKLAQINAQSGKHYQLLYDHLDTGLPYIIKQYLMNHIDLESKAIHIDAAEFTQLIDQYINLYGSGIIAEQKEHTPPSPDMLANCLFHVYCPLYFNDLADARLVLPPVDRNSTKFLVDIDGMVLGSQAAYAEEAACFLACFLSPENMVGLQALNMGPVIADQQKWRVTDNRLALTPSQNAQDTWRQMLQRSICCSLGDQMEYTLRYEFYPALISGKTDTTTFVNRLTQLLMMLLQE